MNLKICFLILYSLSLTYIQSVSSYSVHTVGEYKKEENGICQNGYCGSNNYSHLLEVFKGLFHSTKGLSMLDRRSNNALASPVSKDEPQLSPVLEPMRLYADDGAICCSTHVQHKINTTMTNIFGVSMNIIHLADASEPTYQYILHASCVQTGSCPGECLIESKILTLLTLDANQNLAFGLFEVPGYCSCKNTGSSINESTRR
ncbi:uncharacterized protein LOC123531233 [Mercenaria mercenaria]|uniref:uncharacterized protein LOC123531233 n=1 Tax=Mercenaria mercenaria TaxID=6596 RepID=UPI00234F123B|nr:uncharacterized protein LOC123531233 [Mercenaria mercenaria]